MKVKLKQHIIYEYQQRCRSGGGDGGYISPPIIGPHPPNNYKMHPPQYFKFAKFVKRWPSRPKNVTKSSQVIKLPTRPKKVTISS